MDKKPLRSLTLREAALVARLSLSAMRKDSTCELSFSQPILSYQSTINRENARTQSPKNIDFSSAGHWLKAATEMELIQ